MPDYSKFDKIECSDSEDGEPAAGREGVEEAVDKTNAVFTNLEGIPPELANMSPDLSLVLAAQHGQEHVVQALLDGRAGVNAVDHHGKSALLFAVEGGIANRSTIELLLSRGAATDQASRLGTPIGCAAATGTTDLLEALLNAGAPHRDIRGDALVEALKANNRANAQILLKSGATCNMAAKGGRTPLVAIAELADQEWAVAFARQLLEAGASLVAGSEGPTPLIAAVGNGRCALAKVLMEANADPNIADVTGRRPLATAATVEAQVGSMELCKMLLDNRANVNDRGTSGAVARPGDMKKVEQGVTALSIAATSGNIDLATFLLSSGADTEAVDERGLAPLLVAAKAGSLEVVNLLLGARADANAREGMSGKTALVYAASLGHLSICQALIAAGVEVDAKAVTGASALHAAAANGHSEVCQALLDAGTTPDAPGPADQVPASLAAASGHTGLAAILQSASSKPATAASAA